MRETERQTESLGGDFFPGRADSDLVNKQTNKQTNVSRGFYEYSTNRNCFVFLKHPGRSRVIATLHPPVTF